MFRGTNTLKLLAYSTSRNFWTWSYTQRIKTFQQIHPVYLNGSYVKWYSVQIPSETIQQCLSVDNKHRIIEDLKTKKGNKFVGLKEAAVLVPFCMVDGKPSLLFTLRSTNLINHRGQVSFPGGKRDKNDKSLIDTAVRETLEEIGIKRNQIDVWGPMIPLPDRQRQNVVTAVLSFLGDIDVDDVPFFHDEVSEVFHLTIEHALQNRRYTAFKNGVIMPVFANGPHKIWGLTAVIMDLVFEIMFPGKYKNILKYSLK